MYHAPTGFFKKERGNLLAVFLLILLVVVLLVLLVLALVVVLLIALVLIVLHEDTSFH